MSSSPATTKESEQTEMKTPEETQRTEIPVSDEATHNDLLGEDGVLEADDGNSDSGFGTDSSDTTSIASSMFAGIIENGRRYQTLREGEYWAPTDDKQFESLQAGHVVYTLLDVNQKNPFFRSPLPHTAQHILDVGTGPGEWARQVADMFPNVFVQGVDLYPPPDPFVPPNCKFEVDDVAKTWTFQHKYDLIHIRDMYGSFTNEQWRLLYKQAYKNLLPGGWIEQAETSIQWASDDGSVAPDSILGKWREVFTSAMNKMGKDINTIDTFKAAIEKAGFTNIHEKVYKAAIGDWPKNPLHKEIGRYHKRQALEGLEGYAMFVLTKYGDPEPWSPEEVQVFLAKTRKEFSDPKLHCYVLKRRVWAQKPFDAEPAAEHSEA